MIACYKCPSESVVDERLWYARAPTPVAYQLVLEEHAMQARRSPSTAPYLLRFFAFFLLLPLPLPLGAFEAFFGRAYGL
jgi:hypothetical protein